MQIIITLLIVVGALAHRIEVRGVRKELGAGNYQGPTPGDITTYQQNLIHNLKDLRPDVDLPENSDDGMCEKKKTLAFFCLVVFDLSLFYVS